MEVWLSILIGLLSIAATLLVGLVVGVIYAGKKFKEAAETFSKHLGEAVERVTRAIHEDIKRSQEKLEKKLKD